MDQARRKAEERRRKYKSKLGDPNQLIRISGNQCQLHRDAEKFYYHENQDNLQTWVDNETKIDRFDARMLIDFLPPAQASQKHRAEHHDDEQQLNFERYRDLVEAERLNVSEERCLQGIDEKWHELVKRKDADDPLTENSAQKAPLKATIEHKYETNDVDPDNYVDSSESESDEDAPHVDLLEADLLSYIKDLSDSSASYLREIARKYGIENYVKFVKSAYRDRRDRKRNMNILEEKQKRPPRRFRRRNERNHEQYRNHSTDSSSLSDLSSEEERRRKRNRVGRNSPSYEPYPGYKSPQRDTIHNDSISDMAVKKSCEESTTEFITEFGIDADQKSDSEEFDWETISKSRPVSSTQKLTLTKDKVASALPKKLSMAEKLKLKLRGQLEKQIEKDTIKEERKSCTLDWGRNAHLADSIQPSYSANRPFEIGDAKSSSAGDIGQLIQEGDEVGADHRIAVTGQMIKGTSESGRTLVVLAPVPDREVVGNIGMKSVPVCALGKDILDDDSH
ncbi:alternative splicing regulator-domain-containing protein [Paraphysoderma sedebokerense]|nr:alternative splicing regulator-domain-containing protein [Paraphysoderma sedebokerense]